MGQSTPLKPTPFKPMALVVEDDENQRNMVAMLLEECEMGVVQCDSTEVAMEVLARIGPMLSMLITDASPGGKFDGIELARVAHEHYPDLRVIVSSGQDIGEQLPEQAMFMPKPLLPLNVLREAERSRH
ncbi:MAG TPA: response regulator [Pseudolabrys sp.]|nr:response regulator [Pseudolabrys sp.]